MVSTKQLARQAAWVVAALTFLWIVAKIIYGAQGLTLIPRYGRINTGIARAALKDKAVHIMVNGKPALEDAETIAAALKDTVLVFTTVNALDFADSPPHPASRDTILTIAGKPATDSLWKAETNNLHPVGYAVQVTYRHGGEIQSATLVSRAFPPDRLAVLWTFLWLSASVGLLYFVIGLFTLYKQGNTEQAMVLALLTLALCMVVMNILPSMIRGIAGEKLPEVAWGEGFFRYAGVLATFGTAYWLHLAFIFPFASPTLARHPLKAYILCYAPPVLGLPARLLGPRLAEGTVLGWLAGVAGFAMAVQFIAAIVILRRKRKRTTNTLERRQLNAVFLGSMLGPLVMLVPVLLMIGYALVVQRDTDIPETVIIGGLLFFLCLAFLPIPLSLLYAFRKYRMMEVELKLRRGTRFAVTTGGLLLVFFGLLYGITSLLLHTLAVHSGTAALATGLVLALSFAPVQRRTQRLVEQKIFPERRRLRAMLDTMMDSATVMPDRAALWGTLQNGLRQGMGMAGVTPVLFDERVRAFRLADGTVVPVNPDGDFAAALSKQPRPWLADELLVAERVQLSVPEAAWLREQRASVLLPMIIHTRLTGFLILSFTPEQEDMAAEDLNVLASVVSQVALQSENLRLLEENVEKRRLQEQLDMAREVQQRFLPQVLPVTPGLQVAARFLSSLEVAGDYYDIVPLAEGRTLIAVGDVAGKGAGAAMIMANVQAALRSMAHAGVPLPAIVSGVNDVLCANTSPAQFVTFFATIYNPLDHTFVSINAGHNPPRLVRTDGSIVPLTAGGFCLAVIPEAVYEEETVTVSSGDILVSFTDGVCEAMNAAEEEFGEERIAELCRDRCTAECACLVETIERDVVTFHGSSSFDDDFTLVVVKVM
ncbi:MAG TPA: PP2C family protein-serine/threonine phosphatase [bacterium]|jgi:sigma-B regulation protein RsbU (phosphoserine phosphatase)